MFGTFLGFWSIWKPLWYTQGGEKVFFSTGVKKCVILQFETATALSLAEQSARGKSGQQRVAILPNGKGHVPAKGVLQTVPQKIYRYIRGQKPLV